MWADTKVEFSNITDYASSTRGSSLVKKSTYSCEVAPSTVIDVSVNQENPVSMKKRGYEP